MNQILKERVYAMGNQAQVDFLKHISGMDEEEQKAFQMMHEKKSDEFISDSLGMSRKYYEKVIESMRTKLLVGVMQCINFTMDNERTS